jgi:excisionase family DNA binding protein
MAENPPSEIPGYISSKRAAEILGVSNHRLYQYVKAGRIPVVHVGKAFMLRLEDVQQFKPHPSGRMRSKAPSWRTYRSRGQVIVTDISVQVRPQQQEWLLEKLRSIQQADRHTFPGTIARYVVKGDPELSRVQILLIWKDIEMPDESTQLHHLQAFQEELADVLNWDTAQYKSNETIIHT